MKAKNFQKGETSCEKEFFSFFTLGVNHLGNVLQVVTDRKLAVDDGVYDPITGLYSSDTEDGIVDYFTADVVSQSDYYPFGMLLPGRNSSEDEYRYGFNGMEMDDEVRDSKGTSYTTEFRQYDPRVGKWLSLDPLMAKYPHLSPYVAFNNNPVYFIDPHGLEGDPADGGEPDCGYTCTDENDNTIVYDGDGNWNDVSQYDMSNLYISIRRETSLEGVSYQKETHITSEGVTIFANSFEDALDAVEELYKEKKPDDVFINIHARTTGSVDPVTNQMIYSNVRGINENEELTFDRYDLKSYINGNLDEDNVKKAEIDALFGIVNMTSPGGDCVLGACSIGQDELLVERIGTIYNSQTNKNVNLYINQENTCYKLDGNGRPILSNKLLTSEVILGWILINSEGINQVKDKSHTGNLIYDGNENDSIIRERR